MDPELQASQASSHYTLEPVTGSTLFELETARRRGLSSRGTLRIGCREVDEQVLVNGFERGAVVGISAEEMDTGLLLGLQTVAHNLVFGSGGKPALHRAAVITTLAPQAILPTLRDVIKAQVQTKHGYGGADVNARVRQCLECISVSRVFDIEGLWEVLSELEAGPPTASPDLDIEDDAPPIPDDPDSSPLSSPPASSPVTELPPLRTQKIEKTEILDSEDEDELSSPPPASPTSTDPSVAVAEEPRGTSEPAAQRQPLEELSSNGPDMILITHFSTLLSTLFTQRDKSSAHTILQLLSSHLRYLSRSSGPLVMLLNSTTNTPAHAIANSSTAATAAPGPPGKRPSERPLDPTLRSIFNPPPPTHGGYGPGSMALSRKNKPAFGLTFSQFLHLHLLCTRLPKTRADAEIVFAPAAATTGLSARAAKYIWAVEVLIDEAGFWDGREESKRIDREQSWGAVDVQDGVRIVDAFEKTGKVYNTEMFRLAAGFGGRRV